MYINGSSNRRAHEAHQVGEFDPEVMASGAWSHHVDLKGPSDTLLRQIGETTRVMRNSTLSCSSRYAVEA